MQIKIQYISQGNTLALQQEHIAAALDAGCRWIQLRYKNAGTAERARLAMQVRKLCDAYGATFIVNDHPQLAADSGADGVHLGLTDTAVQTARALLGANAVIGGTANTLADVQQRISEGCNYIGLGPFAFTTTKQNLSPILGLAGYQQIISSFGVAGPGVPIYAIGGIGRDDLPALSQTGIAGVAISGLLTNSGDKKLIFSELQRLMTCQH